MTNPVEIDDNAADVLKDSMKTGEGIELPFPALYLWSINGNAAHKKSADAQYFGGWAGKAEQIADAVEQVERGLPAGLTAAEIATRDGKDYAAYITRQIIVAPIAYRKRWISKDGHQTLPDYAPGFRQHVQCLMALGDIDPALKKVLFWGPAVITAKGFQASYLIATLKEFEKHIESERRKAAPAVPPNCFWRKIGTFGDKPNVKMVGPDGSQSPITPICVSLPDKLSAEKLAGLYVGKETVAEMVRLYSEATEWLAACKAPQKSAPAAEPEFPADPPLPVDENW